ncbi:MAG: glycosyltransferase family 4 protein [Gaiellaceae bacterium]
MTPRADRSRAARYARAGARWTRLLLAGRAGREIRVFYGVDRVPGPGERVAGGTAKLQRLATRFPNHPGGFSILYLGSSGLPPRDLRPLLWIARRRRAPIVLNQDGVGYPGWSGERTEEVNRRLRLALLAADHVLYQSAFCKRSADEFLGAVRGSWEILPNAVDLERFRPLELPPPGGPVLLLGGDQTQNYRLELALRTLAALLPELPDARLLVAGRVPPTAAETIDRLGLRKHVDLVGGYTQAQAPALYRRAHLLLHTKVNDPCPSVVLEAMASGLPVVHPASGGTAELVADEAGLGVAHPDSWERDEPPEPERMAAAVTAVLAELPRYREAARRRAEAHYDLRPWLDRHAELFAQLLAGR